MCLLNSSSHPANTLPWRSKTSPTLLVLKILASLQNSRVGLDWHPVIVTVYLLESSCLRVPRTGRFLKRGAHFIVVFIFIVIVVTHPDLWHMIWVTVYVSLRNRFRLNLRRQNDHFFRRLLTLGLYHLNVIMENRLAIWKCFWTHDSCWKSRWRPWSRITSFGSTRATTVVLMLKWGTAYGHSQACSLQLESCNLLYMWSCLCRAHGNSVYAKYSSPYACWEASSLIPYFCWRHWIDF